jgi:putative transposase
MHYNTWALAPVMAIPSRNADPGEISAASRTFFVTSRTHEGRALLQSERMATLFVDVLRSYHHKSAFTVHDFVVMPDHFHLLITVDQNLSVEKAVQLVKGNFSFRAKRELGIVHDIWQRGFSEERVRDRQSFLAHRKYIGENPVKRGLAETAEDYPYILFHLRNQKKTGAKAH